jgi:hypothetical protein
LLLNTLVTTILWAVIVGVIESGWLSFRHGILKMPDDYT